MNHSNLHVSILLELYSLDRVDTCNYVAVNIRLYEYGHEQVELRKGRCNQKEILLKINM
jgi:hypothetical protein